MAEELEALQSQHESNNNENALDIDTAEPPPISSSSKSKNVVQSSFKAGENKTDSTTMVNSTVVARKVDSEAKIEVPFSSNITSNNEKQNDQTAPRGPTPCRNAYEIYKSAIYRLDL